MDLNEISTALSSGNESEIKKLMSKYTNGYQIYNPFVDPIVLEPGGTTESKEKIFQFSRSDFEGKSVSDLGCNLGAFSFIALNKGAVKVHAYEMSADFKNFLDLVAGNYGKIFPQYFDSLKVTQLNLKTLPKIEQTDVLLSIAIIHWFFVFNQSVTMADVAKWFNDTCNEAVYFEGCVTADEPIMKTYGVDILRFNEKLFMDEMSKYFTVKILGRPSYNPNRLTAKLYKK